MRFGQELFAYITTLVPYWRVCDEAWPLKYDERSGLSEHLTGIGVLRNYEGDAMVIPWSETARQQLAYFGELLAPLSDRIVVVLDDRESDGYEAVSVLVAPIRVIRWSRRVELEHIVIRDSAD